MLWPDLNEQELARLAPYADQVFGARKARRGRFLEFGCTAPNIAGELQAVLPQGERRNKQQVHFHAGVQQQRQQQQQLQQQSTLARRRQRKLLESFDPDAMKHARRFHEHIMRKIVYNLSLFRELYFVSSCHVIEAI